MGLRGLRELHKAIAGEDTNVGNDAVNFLRRYTPGGSIWYVAQAYQRLVLDLLNAGWTLTLDSVN